MTAASRKPKFEEMNLDLGAVATWGSALFAGTWVGIAIASAATGRMIINPRRIEWSFREVEVLSVNMIAQGLALALYALFGAVTLASGTPPFWAGHWWSAFISFPLLVFLMVSLGLQAYVEYRHVERVKSSAGQGASRQV